MCSIQSENFCSVNRHVYNQGVLRMVLVFEEVISTIWLLGNPNKQLRIKILGILYDFRIFLLLPSPEEKKITDNAALYIW